LYAFKSAWAGGWLVFVLAISSFMLALAILRKQKEIPWIFGLILVWILAALIEYVFQVTFLGIGHAIHGLVGILWFIGFALSSLEVFLKFRHSSEFLEHRGQHKN